MTDKAKHYVIEAETGSYRLTGSIGNLIANTTLIASESFVSPKEESIIIFNKGKNEQYHEPISEDKSAIIVPPKFKLVFISVLIITVLAGFGEIVMASIWGTPTGLQKEVFSAMDFAWKAGFGAILGLLGGKVS